MRQKLPDPFPAYWWVGSGHETRNAGRTLCFGICSKRSSSRRYRVDWCINHRLQSNQFVCRPDKEKEKDGENPISIYNCSVIG